MPLPPCCFLALARTPCSLHPQKREGNPLKRGRAETDINLEWPAVSSFFLSPHNSRRFCFSFSFVRKEDNPRYELHSSRLQGLHIDSSEIPACSDEVKQAYDPCCSIGGTGNILSRPFVCTRRSRRPLGNLSKHQVRLETFPESVPGISPFHCFTLCSTLSTLLPRRGMSSFPRLPMLVTFNFSRGH